MSFGLQVVLLLIGLPLLVALVWAVVRASVVYIPVGSLGLLVVRGRATDRALEPGPHWVPALRKRQAVEYPSVELSYRAGSEAVPAASVEASGPAASVVLGDRAEARVSYTVRFRLTRERLRVVHERLGAHGLWSAVRDGSAAAIAARLADQSCRIEDFFGDARARLEASLKEAVEAALEQWGITLTDFTLGAVDFGRHGEAIQATVRARLEAEREVAESANRLLRARHDAELAPYVSASSGAALGYRQVELLQAMAEGGGERSRVALPDAVALRVGGSSAVPENPVAHEQPAAPEPGNGP